MITNVRQNVTMLKYSAKENVHVVNMSFIIYIRQNEALFYLFETEISFYLQNAASINHMTSNRVRERERQ